jgi:hypothetical protein
MSKRSNDSNHDVIAATRPGGRATSAGSSQERTASASAMPLASAYGAWTDDKLDAIRVQYPDGMSVRQIVDEFTAQGEHLTEATFRKYVQLGFLPRSVRVGRKGKHRGSQGLYPVDSLRLVHQVRALMKQGYTMEEIQHGLLGLSNEIESLKRHVDSTFQIVEKCVAERVSLATKSDSLAWHAVVDARRSADEMLRKLRSVEQFLHLQRRMSRAAV